MSINIRNSRELVDPSKFKAKILLFGLPGVGKTEFLGTVPGINIAAAETGNGRGLLTIASKGIPFCEPSSLADFEAICAGSVFKDAAAIGLDSLSYMAKTFVKDAALSIPRGRGESPKRAKGVPELDDYGVMAEITRRLVARLLEQDKHIIVTATEKYSGPDPETGAGELMISPDLPGAMSLGSAAMFDFVLRLRTRQKLRDPKDAKSRYVERYFLTQPDGAGTVAKCRSSISGKALLDKEITFDISTGAGCFPDLLETILKGYAAEAAKEK